MVKVEFVQPLRFSKLTEDSLHMHPHLVLRKGQVRVWTEGWKGAAHPELPNPFSRLSLHTETGSGATVTAACNSRYQSPETMLLKYKHILCFTLRLQFQAALFPKDKNYQTFGSLFIYKCIVFTWNILPNART